ncbi:MAG: ABC transporter ATP-binding protein [Bacilli bacterium]|nr:ABC transporter ATP-binding protein [Bacilli bacterium]
MLQKLSTLPNSILESILPTTIYNNVVITTNDKIALLKISSNMSNEGKKNNITLPESIGKVLFSEKQIDGTIITSSEQATFITEMSKIDSDNQSEIYKKLDTMPKSIRKIVAPSMNMKNIYIIVIVLAIIYLISALFNFIESICMTLVSNNFAKELRSDISDKINKLPLKFFDKHQTGDILSRVTNDVDTIAQTLNTSLGTLVSAIALFIGSIIMMFYTNWIMALTAIFASVFGFIFMALVLGRSQKYFNARQIELGKLNSHIEEIYSGITIVKAYNGEKEANKKFDKLNKSVYECNRKSQFLSGLMMPMMQFIGNFGYVAVCIVGALLVSNDKITFGVIVAFILYVRLFTSPLSQIAQAATSLQSAAAASERVFEFIDEEEMIDESSLSKKLDKNKVKGNIEFKNVVFTYDGNDKPTIKNFSAKVKNGEKIAIVGPTGAGKTTMVNLLMKFYNINDGDILIDGVSINDLSRENIHELFTMVLQDTWLFEGTIKENIIYNRENVSDEKLKEVCKTVGIDHFIKTLPKGFDSIISDNDSVSSGQRQLLTIARGMIEDAPFLILDEATSNVDTRTEELVQKAMDKLTEGRTSFIIAHRLSTIKNADLILVMKDGNIIEQGNHNELMKQKGFYADLYNSQFEL